MDNEDNQKNQTAENKATKKDLYEKLWSARDFELTHQWQRSIFLATFIVLLFTLYFTFVGIIADYNNGDKIDVASNVQVYESDSYTNASVEMLKNGEEDNDSSFLFDECICLCILCGICLVGYCFSVLWVLMAKGSKYMYERIEAGINESYKRDFFDEETKIDFYKEEMDNLWNFGDYTFIPRHGYLPQSDYEYKIFKLVGAKYSSSKINILIGYIFCFVWIVLGIVSGFLTKTDIDACSSFLIGIILGTGIYLTRKISYKTKSGEYHFQSSLNNKKFLFLKRFDPNNNQVEYIVE